VGKKAGHPKLELDDTGTVHIVWEDVGLNNKKDIFYTTVTPSGSNPIAAISASEDSGIVPHTVHFDASGSMPGAEEIQSYWWDFGDRSEMEQGPQVSHSYDKPGVFLAKLYVTDRQLLVGFDSEEIDVLPGPFPPLNISVTKTDKGGLFYREKINAITWEENPKNVGQVIISHHNIYRKMKNQENTEFKLIGYVFHPTFKYADRDFLSSDKREDFAYAVSAVDDKGREGPLGLAGDLTPSGEKKALYSSMTKFK
jgi:hypothetical protein